MSDYCEVQFEWVTAIYSYGWNDAHDNTCQMVNIDGVSLQHIYMFIFYEWCDFYDFNRNAIPNLKDDGRQDILWIVMI